MSGVDAGIYQNLRNFEMPSLADSQQKAMSLKSLGMQQQQMQQESAAKAKENQYAEHMRKVSVLGNALESLSGLDPASRAAAYPQARAELLKSGVIGEQDAPPEYHEGAYRTALMQYRQTKEHLEKAKFQQDMDASKLGMQKTKAEIDKLNAEAYKARQYGTKYGSTESTPDGAPAMAPRARLDKFGGEVKQKVGHLTSGLSAITKYEDAFRTGGRQTYIDASSPIVGKVISSTPITEARTAIEEAIGRLASGGAINTDEENRFRSMIPRAADDDATAARKLMDLRKDMEGKLTAYGFKIDELPDLGYEPQALGYGTEFAGMETRGLLGKNAGQAGVAHAATPALKLGTEEDGYVYLGGDPAQQSSWKKRGK